MKIAADTNVLLRDVLQDNPTQSHLARKTLQYAELVAIPVSVLCEFVWVLRQGYKRPASDPEAGLLAFEFSDGRENGRAPHISAASSPIYVG